MDRKTIVRHSSLQIIPRNLMVSDRLKNKIKIYSFTVFVASNPRTEI